MKKAILTYSKAHNLSKHTFPFMEQYAKNINADFIIIKSLTDAIIFDKYDRVCILAPHVLVRPESPNIFDEVPEDELGIFNEAAFNSEAKQEKFYNAGVIVYSKIHKEAFNAIDLGLIRNKQYLGTTLTEMKLKIHELDYKFNRIPLIDFKTGETRFKSWFLNYENLSDFKIIENDIKTIKEFPATHPWKRKVWVKLGGGIGDQVDCEPILRYMIKNIYPPEDTDVRVSSHWPELFRHLPIKVYMYGEAAWADSPSGAPWTVESMPPPEHYQWLVVSAMLCHAMDFSAMAILRRVLPIREKQIKLDFSYSALREVVAMCDRSEFNGCDFNGCVIVHSGRHWTSKSFPVEYWQAIIDGIEDKGMTPILIGKNDKTQGVQDVHTKNGINLIDKLTLGQLVALISQVPSLLSNDSAPVHIAGGFSNQIILIPTCKDPDHILPWREGSQGHKTTVLYKKLTLDDIPSEPTSMNTVLADEIVGEWDEYLPEIDEVVEAVFESLYSGS